MPDERFEIYLPEISSGRLECRLIADDSHYDFERSQHVFRTFEGFVPMLVRRA